MSESKAESALTKSAVPLVPKLSFGHYRFWSVADESIHLPGFAGATLRGALGHALRELSCMTGQPDCLGCPLLGNCRYPALFEPKLLGRGDPRQPTPPPPYIIRSPVAPPRTYQRGETFEFEMVLFDLTPADLELILRAWQRALWKGLGTRKGRARLSLVQQAQDGQWVNLFQPCAGQWSSAAPSLEAPDPPQTLKSLTLMFVSPVRLQHRGRLCLANQLSVDIVAGALKRRLQHLIAPQSMPMRGVFDTRSLSLKTDMRLYRWERQSSRQGCNIRLDGLLGNMELAGSGLADWWPWLWLGQYTHIGKNVSHGLGQYQLLTTDS
ncbi:CRISPR system precrRNA processing endoribonuclease RAMP protein Cas6 [Halomonas qaidamensis]|uniref:CRISPR system precrRNA processing endoribonuclease RAMP protein Cas6 n=1 Tax=Halomonas qaidamensis TaxID=2866211 RepID=A0ABY6JR94_9GAMM|nr:CRISPR system precrRNA processing endoribonuclease RAMP protein Cas6 [Halomonas qaidamensis]UYV19465.1 CRISPR system precrRNA processing endoribonuclease RAMP protein Cas6 [Halomonas qaidamensis]